VVKAQYRDFIIGEFRKCIQYVSIARERSKSPSVVDIAPQTIEHRDKNIFSNKKKNSRGSTSVVTSNQGSKSQSDLIEMIREKQTEEEESILE
jgi:hypothetical protein